MIHWFKKHPKHLANESRALSTDSNYKEICQFRENLFISHGNIIVRLDKIYRFPILIVYPEQTPYALPYIYPLKRVLSKEEVEELAKETQSDLLTKLRTLVEYFYKLRHQNITGSLCVLEWDNLDNGAQFYGIKSILERVRDWFAGHITGVFPPDSQEVEFCAHFNMVDFQYSLLYPDSFLDTKLMEGEAFYFILNKIPAGKISRTPKFIYFGSLITGTNAAGIYDHTEFMLPSILLDEGIKTPIDLVTKPDIIESLKKSERLISITWFQIESEPSPFQTLDELISIIGNGDFNAGIKRMMPLLEEELKKKPNTFFIAIRFPNRKGIQEFQAFTIKKKDSTTGVLLNTDRMEAFTHLKDAYEVVMAIPSERFSDTSFHQRNEGRIERDVLKEKIVNFIGVGALGSELADSFAKAGTGTVCLFDFQEMKSTNSVRHLAGVDFTGIAKVNAVAEILFNHNPFVSVYPVNTNIATFDVDEFFDGSISISSIADDNVEGFLNEQCVSSNKVVYYVRALRGAKAARIFRVIPGKDACINCLSLYRSDSDRFFNIDEDKTLPTIKNECNNPIRPGSAADLKLISALASRIILDEIQGDFEETNHWIWSTEDLAGVAAFAVRPQTFKPHPKCFYCNHEQKSKVLLPSSLQKRMAERATNDPTIETGGVLAGYKNDQGDYIITDVSEAGPNAVRSATKFSKDVIYCQEFLDKLYQESGGKIVYVGEWHSHPNQSNSPSGTDIRSLKEISYQKEYLTDSPLMIIFTNTGTPSATIHPAGKSFYYSEIVNS